MEPATKIKIEIKSIIGKLLFTYEKEENTIKDTVEAAIKAGADLRSADLSSANLRSANLHSANLRSADLRSADLSDANLRSADLSYADLSDANLRSANLRSADLSDADLSDANLRSANLSYADLSDADLRSADLRSADLSYADLSYADLSDANLHSADLSYANLSYANLSSADLRSADLRSADLRSADLSSIKNDMWAVLLHGIPEIPFLKKNIIEGKIDGSTYDGECTCLSGTLVNGAKITDGAQENIVIKNIMKCRDSHRPIEVFFARIKKGDTPETNPVSKLALEWLESFEDLINSK